MRCWLENVRFSCAMFTLIGLVYVCEPVDAQEHDFDPFATSFDLDSSDDHFARAEQALRGRQVILEFDRPTQVDIVAISNPGRVPLGGFAVIPLDTNRTEWLVASRHYPQSRQRIDVIEARDYVIVLSAFGESSGYGLLLRPGGLGRLTDAVAGDSENDLVELAPTADREFATLPERTSESVVRRVERFGEEIGVFFSHDQAETLSWLLQQVYDDSSTSPSLQTDSSRRFRPKRPGTDPPGSSPIDPDGEGGIASIVCCTQNSVSQHTEGRNVRLALRR